MGRLQRDESVKKKLNTKTQFVDNVRKIMVMSPRSKRKAATSTKPRTAPSEESAQPPPRPYGLPRLSIPPHPSAVTKSSPIGPLYGRSQQSVPAKVLDAVIESHPSLSAAAKLMKYALNIASMRSSVQDDTRRLEELERNIEAVRFITATLGNTKLPDDLKGLLRSTDSNASKCNEFLLKYRRSSVSGKKKMWTTLESYSDNLSVDGKQLMTAIGNQLVAEGMCPSPSSIVSSIPVSSYFQSRSSEPDAAPIASSSRSDPVIDDAWSEISISVVPPTDSSRGNFGTAETRSLYQAYNVSRFSFHAPEPISRNISGSSTQTLEDEILEDPQLEAEGSTDQHTGAAGTVEVHSQTPLDPSFSVWEACIKDWDTQSVLYNTHWISSSLAPKSVNLPFSNSEVWKANQSDKSESEFGENASHSEPEAHSDQPDDNSDVYAEEPHSNAHVVEETEDTSGDVVETEDSSGKAASEPEQSSEAMYGMQTSSGPTNSEDENIKESEEKKNDAKLTTPTAFKTETFSSPSQPGVSIIIVFAALALFAAGVMYYMLGELRHL